MLEPFVEAVELSSPAAAPPLSRESLYEASRLLGILRQEQADVAPLHRPLKGKPLTYRLGEEYGLPSEKTRQQERSSKPRDQPTAAISAPRASF